MTMTLLLEPEVISSSTVETRAGACGADSHPEAARFGEQTSLNVSTPDSNTRHSRIIHATFGKLGDTDHTPDLLWSAGPSANGSDLLFSLLAYIYPSEVARSLGEQLLGRFGSLGNLFAAPWSRIQAVQGATSELVGLIKIIHAVVVHTLREPLLERPLIGSCEKLRDYLKATLAHSSVEIVRILFLDGGNRLIKDEQHSQGTIDHVSLCSREIVRRIMELDARAIILVHNHPAGRPEPSLADREATRRLAATLSGIGVRLHDHVIVCQSRFLSFRQLGLL
jgi:DNA repair protein RadC